MSLQKGLGTIQLWPFALNCGSFLARRVQIYGIIEGLYRQFKVCFPFWLESLTVVFVNIIRYFSTSGGRLSPIFICRRVTQLV